jgi:DNA-binding NarL/FixJ family response regulator
VALRTKTENPLSSIRILVADDYEGWRRQICRLLHARPELQVICEVWDGSEAVQKAEELKPDLILLDIGLPKLNGIEAARQIRQLSPESKVLFLSQESSADVVQEALKSGGLGYVVKAHAGTELLAAVEAVLQGRRFVSRDLLGQEFIQTTYAQVPNRLPHVSALPSRLQATLWPVLVSLFVLAAAGVVLGLCNYQQRSVIRQIAAREAELDATIGQLHSQLQDATTKINNIAAVQAAKATAAATAARSEARAAAAEATMQSARLRLLQSAVNDQQRQIQATRAEMAKTHSDLEGNLNSTRNELSGSIARTHEDLVALEKRGERDYFEFDAAKSKQFLRAGPLNLSARRTDTKHSNVDLVLVVNDREISKKSVNLYEPVWIYETQDSQPVQVVVNKIEKNWAHGYVSAPKYSRADLSTISAPAAPQTSSR